MVVILGYIILLITQCDYFYLNIVQHFAVICLNHFQGLDYILITHSRMRLHIFSCMQNNAVVGSNDVFEFSEQPFWYNLL